MANHNELKKFSTTPQPNTAVYSDESGYISDWLNNDPVIATLKQQTEFIGVIPTIMVGEVAEIPSGEDLQTFLSQFVYQTLTRLPQDYDEVHIVDVDQTWIYYNNVWVQKTSANLQQILSDFVQATVSRQARNGDEVALEADGDLWLYNGTSWIYFSNTTLKDATYTTKGVVQIGSGLLVTNGLVSVDSSIYTPSREVISSTSTTPSIAPLASKDYVFSNNLTSLTLTSIPNSSYYTTITFVPAAGFTLTATGLSQYFYYSTPTFITGRTYRLTIVNGRCYVDYTGARVYPINKIVATNPALTPTDGIVTWSITNTLGTSEIILRVLEISTGATVAVDSTTSASTITVAFNADSTVAADTYKIIAIG